MNALGMEVAAAAGFTMEGLRMLSVMPLFHGFGLGVGIHTPLINGARAYSFRSSPLRHMPR